MLGAGPIGEPLVHGERVGHRDAAVCKHGRKPLRQVLDLVGVPLEQAPHLSVEPVELRAGQVGRRPVHIPVLGQYGVVLGVQRVGLGRDAVVEGVVAVAGKAAVHAVAAVARPKGRGRIGRAVLFVHAAHFLHDRV